jgi:broad specificity phosphatase PhoE
VSGLPPHDVVPEGLDAAVVLLRHGESAWVAEGRFQGHGDPPLTALGRRQAALAAARLATPQRIPALPLPGGTPREIVHSPLGRAAETARSVAAAMAASGADPAPPLRADAGFLEIGQGEWEGRLGTEIAERWGDVLAAWRRDPLSAWAPGGESVAEVDLRVRAALRSLLGDLGRGRPRGTVDRSQVLGYADAGGDEPWAVIVAHDGVFKVALLALLDLPLARFWSFPFALCGITVVEFKGGRPRLRLHNGTDHLAELEDEAAREREAARAASGAL